MNGDGYDDVMISASRYEDNFHIQGRVYVYYSSRDAVLETVEVVGTILLVALVGAIAIVIQGNPKRRASNHTGAADG